MKRLTDLSFSDSQLIKIRKFAKILFYVALAIGVLLIIIGLVGVIVFAVSYPSCFHYLFQGAKVMKKLANSETAIEFIYGMLGVKFMAKGLECWLASLGCVIVCALCNSSLHRLPSANGEKEEQHGEP